MHKISKALQKAIPFAVDAGRGWGVGPVVLCCTFPSSGRSRALTSFWLLSTCFLHLEEKKKIPQNTVEAFQRT